MGTRLNLEFSFMISAGRFKVEKLQEGGIYLCGAKKFSSHQRFALDGYTTMKKLSLCCLLGNGISPLEFSSLFILYKL